MGTLPRQTTRTRIEVLNHQPVPLQSLDEVLDDPEDFDVLYLRAAWEGETEPTAEGWVRLHDDEYYVWLDEGSICCLDNLDLGVSRARRLQPGERLVVTYSRGDKNE
jgi:hypothetical protein